LQLVPLILTFFVYYLPQLLQKKPDFQYNMNYEYSYKRFTNKLNVPYFVKYNFNDKFKNNNDLIKIENDIENGYENYLKESCYKNKKYMAELKFRQKDYKKKGYYYQNIQREIEKIDISVCDKLNKFREVKYENNQNENENDKSEKVYEDKKDNNFKKDKNKEKKNYNNNDINNNKRKINNNIDDDDEDNVLKDYNYNNNNNKDTDMDEEKGKKYVDIDGI